ncbi:MAG: YtxH domain-containing protein [Gemmatimonadetes bacterium]|nr:YtxH domain-containing protein [Gemmatimonadota bacterium]
MRDDEVPYIVIERERGGGGSSIGSFVLGALVGAGVALLFAPQSGEETQEQIRRRARKLRAQADDRLRTVQEKLESRIESARSNVQNRVDSVRGAVESGRQAARDARADLEKRLEETKAAYRTGLDGLRGAGRTAGGPPSRAAEPDTEGA